MNGEVVALGITLYSAIDISSHREYTPPLRVGALILVKYAGRRFFSCCGNSPPGGAGVIQIASQLPDTVVATVTLCWDIAVAAVSCCHMIACCDSALPETLEQISVLLVKAPPVPPVGTTAVTCVLAVVGLMPVRYTSISFNVAGVIAG